MCCLRNKSGEWAMRKSNLVLKSFETPLSCWTAVNSSQQPIRERKFEYWNQGIETSHLLIQWGFLDIEERHLMLNILSGIDWITQTPIEWRQGQALCFNTSLQAFVLLPVFFCLDTDIYLELTSTGFPQMSAFLTLCDLLEPKYTGCKEEDR